MEDSLITIDDQDKLARLCEFAKESEIRFLARMVMKTLLQLENMAGNADSEDGE